MLNADRNKNFRIWLSIHLPYHNLRFQFRQWLCDAFMAGADSAQSNNVVPKEVGRLEVEKALALALRTVHGVKQDPLPSVGDIVEVDGVLGVCTEYHKGWCYVRQMSDDLPWLDFISDEARHGPCGKKWRVRKDL